MNYHLNRNGRNLGIFSLDELQQRLANHELTGQELVWTPGMKQWQTLNSVLGRPSPTGAPRPSAAAEDSNRTFVVAWILIVTILLGAVLTIDILFHNLARPSSGTTNYTSSALRAARKPVPKNPRALTEADVNKAAAAFRMRQYVDGYLQRGERDPECDWLAANLLTNWISCKFVGPINTNLPSLSKLSDQLAADPHCTDPLVLAVTAVNCDELMEQQRRLERALKGFPSSQHLGYPKFYTTAFLALQLTGTDQVRLPYLDKQSLQFFQQAMSDGSITPADQKEIADSLILGWGRDFFGRQGSEICSLVEQKGPDFRWLTLVLRGEYEINEAWKARGGGYANSVTAEGWKTFEADLAQASHNLTEAWSLRPDLPLAPDLMIYVSLGISDINDMRTWFDRTVSIQIDYPDAWKEMRWGLRPRWNGDENSMLAFGLTALNTGRFDTDVPRKYFDSIDDVQSERNGEWIYGRDDIWPNLQKMYEGYIREPSVNDYDRAGWRSSYAVVAYLAGHNDVARTQLEKLNWQPHPENLLNWGIDLSAMTMEVAARTGPAGDKINASEAAHDGGDLAGALLGYHQLSTSSNLDNLTRAFVADRLKTVNMEQQLAADQWVDFLPQDTNFVGWHVSFGQVQVLPDGSVEVHSDEYGHMLYSRAQVGTNLEVRGEFDVVSSSSRSFQAGLVMGIPEMGGYHWLGFRMKRNEVEGDVVSASENWTRRQVSVPVHLNDRHNTFDFRLEHGRVTATLNDTLVLDHAPLPRNLELPNQLLLGLGAYNDSNSTVVRYRNIQARLLEGAAQNANADAAPQMFVPMKINTQKNSPP